MEIIVELIDEVISNINDETVIAKVAEKVQTMMAHRPLFAW
jgi:glycine hydroxymethyltransferase